MKKLNKLFAILIAVLGVQTLSAQMDVTDQYLTNAGFDDGTNGWTYGGSGTNYGGVAEYGSSTTYNSVTNVSVDKFGKSEGSALHTSAGWGSPSFYTQEVTFPAGEYKITFDVINRNSSATKITNRFGWIPNSGTAVYCSATDIIYNAWQTISVSFTLAAETTGKISVGMVSTSGSGSGAVAKLFTDNVRIFKMDEASSPTIANPIDYSDLINQSTWSYTEDDGSGSNSSLTTNVDKGEWPYRMVERYRGAKGHYGKKLYQTVSVPAGVYQVQAACMSAHANGVEGSNALADGTLNNAYFYANEEEVTYPLANATSSFQKHIVTLTEDGSIEFGVKTVAVGANWNAIGCATVIKVANSYEEYLEDLLGESYTERQTLIGKLEALQSKLPDPYYNNTVAPAIASANEANTQETLSEANNTLRGILTNAESMVEPYANLTDLIDLCTGYTQNSNANTDDVLTSFKSAINTATTAGNEATTVDAINAAYSTLETARQTYAQNAVPVYPYPFDMTFMLPNTTFDSNTDGWTKTGGANWMDAGNVECYNTTFEFSMEYTGLNNGSWEIQVDAFYRYGGYNAAEAAHNGGTEQLHATLYANNNSVAVKSIMDGANAAGNYGQPTAGGVYVPNAPSHCDTYFATGCYANSIATVIADGKLKVGIKKETTQGSDWTIFDNFKLIYKGIDVTDLQTALSELVEKADAIKDDKMGATESTALTTALDNADAESTDADDLSTMISDLQNAYDNAVASIATYTAVSAYITKAEGIDASIATTYRTQYNNGAIEDDAETVRQALNVATYEYASDIFSNKIEVTGWTGTMGGMNTSSQHWDGTSTTKYYDNNSWGGTAHSTTANITLPKGTYVLKAALRSHASTTLTLTVLDNVVDVEGKGDTGYGIDVNGNATFAEEATYANEDKGRGWEWEFVKFELTEETTVTLTVECDYNGVYGWASFSDITLWMDDDTYVTVNGDAINAPLTEANTLVNTLPMGKAENAELLEAIALCETKATTPDELNAQIEALETSVANANTWRSTYYTEKDKLVAALERFEADYNDAENGALDYMCKSRWATAIEKAQAAAVAKDDLTSHAGLTTATTELTAALDAATVSISEYADLKAAIDEANALAGANIGDEPFQRPQNAADALATTEAQSIYDTAEADGEGVTTKTTALEEAITTFNNTPLNAPGDAMFNVIINGNEGYKYNGRAVTFKEGATAENYSMGYTELPGSHYNQAIKFIAAEDLNCYYMSFEDAEGNTYYIGTGKTTGFGSDDAQIRSTADQAKAIPFRIEASTQDGIYYVWNTVINKRIGGNGSDNTGLFTAEQNDYKYYNFNLLPAEKASVTLTISEVGWATLILPFDADCPEGVRALTCAEADGEVLNLVEAGSIVANTPYLMNGAAGTYTFSGYGLADKDSYTAGLFTGTYVGYKTTAGTNTYVLQKNNGVTAFYLVGESGQPTVGANRCYMTYVPTESEAAPMFILGRGDETSIDNAQLSNENVVIYDLMGRKVSTMEKGGMYIVNGKKVVIK